MKTEEVINFANACSNEDLCLLINIMANRFECYFGSLNRCQLSSEIQSACINGATIQINCKTVELDDIADDPFIKYAIEKGVKA